MPTAGCCLVSMAVALLVPMMMAVAMPMVVMITPEQPCAGEVHAQAQHGDPESLTIGNNGRCEEPSDRLRSNP